MSISSVGTQSTIPSLLLNDLQKSGLSSDAVTQVQSEIESVVQAQRSSSSGTPASPTDIRTAIEAKLKEDVSSGALTQDQADQVVTALDQFESQIQQSGGPDPSKLFSKLDSDGDGKLTEDEFVAGRPDNVSEDQAKELYAKIAEKSGGDASSGLTQDQFSSGFAAAAPSGPPPGGGAPPAGGGGGGAQASGGGGGSGSGSSDEVVSVTTTTSADGTKTTVTKYGDGSTSTSVTYGQGTSSSAESLQSILKALTEGKSDSNSTNDYLGKLLKSGNLIDTLA